MSEQDLIEKIGNGPRLSERMAFSGMIKECAFPLCPFFGRLLGCARMVRKFP